MNEPYDRAFILNKLGEYSYKIKENKKGKFEIKKKIQGEGKLKGYLYEIENDIDLPIIELTKDDSVIMRIDTREIEGTFEIIKWARGKVGIVGLGLGYVVQELAQKKEVSEVIVYEKEKEIIDFYNQNFKKDKKIKIINEDAFESKRQQFDLFYVDIYEYELSLDVVKDYKKFLEIHDIEEYSFWGVEHFLLSCSYDEIVWVYIPENWMTMSKNISGALDSSGYIDYYKQLDEKLVSEVLAEFKLILNSDDEEEE